jgi:hypothetical protein
MDFFAGVVAGYVVSGTAIGVTFVLGTISGVLLVCVLGARRDDACADEACVRRVR